MHAGNKKQQSETKKKQVQNVQRFLITKNKTREIPEFLVRTNTPSVCVNASIGAQESQQETSGQRAWQQKIFRNGQRACTFTRLEKRSG
jgi:hypothetical protein